MMEKVEHYFDSCMVHTVKEKDKEHEFGVYHQKHMFYSQNYETVRPYSQTVPYIWNWERSVSR